MTVGFGPWYPLGDAGQEAPAAAGLFQIKLPHVIDYPTGKSAMIHYGLAADLRAALSDFAAGHPGVSWLARHQVVAGDEDLGAALATLVDRFSRRFGTAPTLPDRSPA